ncbi:MAG: hypothetical protein LBT05_17060 [Planctomycetaceae bacterium]|jgi:hypothetical protein|nr:hypothetical protein [Planctomycetaceae bacterium]
MKKLNKAFDFLELRHNVSGGGGYVTWLKSRILRTVTLFIARVITSIFTRMIACISVLSGNISARLKNNSTQFGNRFPGRLVRKRLNKISVLRRHVSRAFTPVELLVVIAIHRRIGRVTLVPRFYSLRLKMRFLFSMQLQNTLVFKGNCIPCIFQKPQFQA